MEAHTPSHIITFCRYMLMQQCWELEPKDRPGFSDLVSSLSQSLEAMAGYMDVGTFGQLQVHSASVSKPGDGEKPEDHRPFEEESKGNEIMEVKFEETSM